MNVTLAVIGGSGLLNQLLLFGLIIICVIIVWFIVKKGLEAFEAPPIALKIWNFIVLAVSGVALINFLMGLAGHPFVSW